MRATLVFFCMALAFVAAQAPGFQDILVIDEYTTITRSLIVETEPGVTLPSSKSASTADKDILGGERDLQIIFLTGEPNLVISSGVATGNFQAATPNGGTGRATCQYDGIDGSINLNPSGLGGVNFRAQGATSLRGAVNSDFATTVTFIVYSGSVNSKCTAVVDVPGGDKINDYLVPFSSFSSGCDFNNVGAVEIVIDLRENVDVNVNVFSVYGPIPPTPTPSPSRSNGPSNTPSSSLLPSDTPSSSKPPSASNTPSNTPSPSDACQCFCPAFNCNLVRAPEKNVNTFSYYLTSQVSSRGNNGVSATRAASRAPGSSASRTRQAQRSNNNNSGNSGNGNSGNNNGNSGNANASSSSILTMSIAVALVVMMAF